MFKFCHWPVMWPWITSLTSPDFSILTCKGRRELWGSTRALVCRHWGSSKCQCQAVSPLPSICLPGALRAHAEISQLIPSLRSCCFTEVCYPFCPSWLAAKDWLAVTKGCRTLPVPQDGVSSRETFQGSIRVQLLSLPNLAFFPLLEDFFFPSWKKPFPHWMIYTSICHTLLETWLKTRTMLLWFEGACTLVV